MKRPSWEDELTRAAGRGKLSMTGKTPVTRLTKPPPCSISPTGSVAVERTLALTNAAPASTARAAMCSPRDTPSANSEAPEPAAVALTRHAISFRAVDQTHRLRVLAQTRIG